MVKKYKKNRFIRRSRYKPKRKTFKKKRIFKARKR